MNDSVVVLVAPGSSPEDACRVFFDGDYHYCGDANGGYVVCCPAGGEQ